jgi:4-amino-4-deoxy-L-arabinose transferase-like glycosyltransferase
MANKRFIYLLIVFAVAFFLRFYKLGEIPNGLYQDETAIGYNAYSILETGKDEHGLPYPLYFRSFGDYKLPVYIYLTVPSVKFFGLTPFAVRLPSAIFGLLTVIAFYFFINCIQKNKTLSLLATALLAINPWHLHYSRATFEVSIALFLFIAGAFTVIRSFDRKKSSWFVIGSVCFVIAVYTYNFTRLLSPLLYASLLYIYRDRLSNLPRSGLIWAGTVSALLLVPFIWTISTGGGIASASGTLWYSSAVVRAPLLELKSYAVAYPFLSRILLNTPLLLMWQYIQNVFSYLSVPFFFINGPSHGNHGIGNAGLFYLFELPLIAFGHFYMVKSGRRHDKLLIAWALVTVLLAAATRDVPHATRSFFLIPTLVTVSAYGLTEIIGLFGGARNPKKIILGSAGLLAACFLIGMYLFSYYVRFPVMYSRQWRSADGDLAVYLASQVPFTNTVFLDRDSGPVYTSILFYTKYDPKLFQDTSVWSKTDSEGFSKPIKFYSYEYRDIDWNNPIEDNALAVGNPRQTTLTSLRTFSYPTRPVVIADKQEILQYPVTETAYSVFSN